MLVSNHMMSFSDHMVQTLLMSNGSPDLILFVVMLWHIHWPVVVTTAAAEQIVQ